MDEISRSKLRIKEKEQQCEVLRKEAERAIESQVNLERRIDRQTPISKPAAIQTDSIEEHLLIYQENDRLKRECE